MEMLYVKKEINFLWLFSYVRKKISTNLIIEMEFCIKANPKKFIMYLYSIWHHIINHLEKFYVKNPLVRGEIK